MDVEDASQGNDQTSSSQKRSRMGSGDSAPTEPRKEEAAAFTSVTTAPLKTSETAPLRSSLASRSSSTYSRQAAARHTFKIFKKI